MGILPTPKFKIPANYGFAGISFVLRPVFNPSSA